MVTLAPFDVAMVLAIGAIVGFIAGHEHASWLERREWKRTLRAFDAQRSTTTAHEFVERRRLRDSRERRSS